MKWTLCFEDPVLEQGFETYCHVSAALEFRKQMLALIIVSAIALIYNFVSHANYFAITWTVVLVQAIFAIFLARKSMLWLNFTSFLLSLEFQTGAIFFVYRMQNEINALHSFVAAQSIFSILRCLTLGTKLHLHLILLLAITGLEMWAAFESSTILIFLIYSAFFQAQHIYSFQRDKRQKYLLHCNDNLIQTSFLNSLNHPIIKCYFDQREFKCNYIDSNVHAQSVLQIRNQPSFNSFIRNCRKWSLVQHNKWSARFSSHSLYSSYTLEKLIYNFSKPYKASNSLIGDSTPQATDSPAFSCQLAYKREIYFCQFLKQYSEQGCYFLINLQLNHEVQINRLEDKISYVNKLLTRLSFLSLNLAGTSLNSIGKLQKLQKMKTPEAKMLYHSLIWKNMDTFMFNANLLIYFNANKVNEAPVAFSIKQMVLNIVSAYRFRMKSDLQIKLDFSDQKDYTLCNCELQTYIVFLNLIQNAFKFARDTVIIYVSMEENEQIKQSVLTLKIVNDHDLESTGQRDKIQLGFLTINKLLKLIGYQRLEITNSKHYFSCQCSLLNFS